jgi:hypothetical protein
MGRFRLGLLCIFLISGTMARADAISYTGNLTTNGNPDPNAVFEAGFTLAGVSEVILQSWSYGGGTNMMGTTIAPLGFQPDIAVFSSNPVTVFDSGVINLPACPPGNTDDLGACGDARLDLILGAGTYTFSVTTLGNFPTSNDPSGSFNGMGEFGTNGDAQLLDDHFAVDLTVTPQSAVPEPGAGFMLGSGLLVLLGNLLRQRRR